MVLREVSTTVTILPILLALLPIFHHATAVENMLGSTTWLSATVGWGNVHKNRSIVGNPLKLNGHTYATGIGTHANSQITYNLGKSCSSFQSDIGVDDEQGKNGTVTFEVWGDGKKLYSSPVMRGGSIRKKVRVSLANVRTLVLKVTDAGDGINYDHADWAGGKIICTRTLSGGGTGKKMSWKTGYWYGNGFGGPNPPYSLYTHVLYESISPSGGTGIDTSPANLSELDAFVSAAHAVGTKALICLGVADIGPWQGSTSPSNVSGFASSVASFVSSHNLDGVDLDWESGIINSQYGAFIQALRSAMGSSKVISIASYGGGGGNPKNSILAAGVGNIDQVNLMTYDMDRYQNLSWYQTAINTGPNGESSIEQAISEFVDAGIPVEKIGIGIPFYGSAWGGISGPYQSKGGVSTRQFSQINTFGNTVDQTYGGQSVGANPWVTYVGPELINRIVAYGTSRGVGGYMTFPINWEDNSNTLSNALSTYVGTGGSTTGGGSTGGTTGGGATGIPPAGYALTYSEEFNGATLPSPWQLGYYFSNTVPGSQVTVSGGALHLTWQSGGVNDISVSSTQTFHYGYFEVRMKWDTSVGAWPAFWFIPPQSAGSHTGEIDVFEGQGNDNQAFFATLHEWNGQSQIWASDPNRFPVSTDFSQYHTYALLWEPGGKFTWYFDGAVIHTFTGAPSIFDTQSVFPILSMQMGNDWNVGNTSGVSSTSLTNDIDYFRVYQPSTGTTVGGVPPGGTNPGTGGTTGTTGGTTGTTGGTTAGSGGTTTGGIGGGTSVPSYGSIIQTGTNGITPTLEVHSTTSMVIPLGSPSLPGDTIAVFLYLDSGNISYPAVSSVTDNRGNSYSQVCHVRHGTNSGPGLDVWFCPNAIPGVTLITVHYTFDWLGFGSFTAEFTLAGIAVELSGLGPFATLQDSSTVHNYGGYTSILTLSDSHSNSFTATINSPNNYNVWAFVDFSGNAMDLEFVAGGSPSPTPDDTVTVSPGNSSTLIASVLLPSYGHFGLYSGALALSPVVRGNIDYDQVGLDARQGRLHGRKIAYTDGSYTPGKVPIYLDDGTLSSSDIAPSGPGSGIGTDLFTAAGDLLTFDGSADVRFARGADGYMLSSQSAQSDGLLWIPNPTSALTTRGDLLTHNGTGVIRFGAGTDGYMLSSQSSQADGLLWIPNPANLLSTRGDLLGHNGTTSVRFGVGADDTVLIADSTQADGFRWGTTASVSATNPWDASINFVGKMTNGQSIPIASLRRATTIPANFSGSGGFVLGTNPAASTTLSVKKNGTSIGTVSVSTSGVFTFATTSGAIVNGVLNDQLVLANQASADVSFDTFNITFAFLR